MTTPPRVHFDPAGGIEVERGLLWLDAKQPKALGVITHAHGDHVGRHRRIVCTPATAAFVRKRTGHKAEYVEREFGEPFVVGDLTVTLHRAGHILGAAMVKVCGPGGSVLYSGDFKMTAGVTTLPAEPPRADHLVMEATFGLPEYRFPDDDGTRAALITFAQQALRADETPVFLGYALGKGQEIAALLSQAGVPCAVHPAIWNLCPTYRAHGVKFPGAVTLKRNPRDRCAVVVTPRLLRTPEVQQRGPLKLAVISGWAGRLDKVKADAVFGLSDHADYDQLVTLVERVAPQRIDVLHGYADEFAADLRMRGYDAHAVAGHRGPRPGETPGMFRGLRSKPQPKPDPQDGVE